MCAALDALGALQAFVTPALLEARGRARVRKCDELAVLLGAALPFGEPGNVQLRVAKKRA